MDKNIGGKGKEGKGKEGEGMIRKASLVCSRGKGGERRKDSFSFQIFPLFAIFGHQHELKTGHTKRNRRSILLMCVVNWI